MKKKFLLLVLAILCLAAGITLQVIASRLPRRPETPAANTQKYWSMMGPGIVLTVFGLIGLIVALFSKWGTSAISI